MNSIERALNRIYLMTGRSEEDFVFFMTLLCLKKRGSKIELIVWILGEQGCGKSGVMGLLALIWDTYQLNDIHDLTEKFNSFMEGPEAFVCHETRTSRGDTPQSKLAQKVKQLAERDVVVIEQKGVDGNREIPNKADYFFLSNILTVVKTLVPDPLAQRRHYQIFR